MSLMLSIMGLEGMHGNTTVEDEMRGMDWNLAITVRNYWQGKPVTVIRLCPLLADLDRLLSYLDETSLRPGHAIDCCPECQNEHRWALLKMLMGFALQMRPANQSRLLMEVEQEPRVRARTVRRGKWLSGNGRWGRSVLCQVGSRQAWPLSATPQ